MRYKTPGLSDATEQLQQLLEIEYAYRVETYVALKPMRGIKP